MMQISFAVTVGFKKMRDWTICETKSKSSDQLCSNCTADMCLSFRICRKQSLFSICIPVRVPFLFLSLLLNSWVYFNLLLWGRANVGALENNKYDIKGTSLFKL